MVGTVNQSVDTLWNALGAIMNMKETIFNEAKSLFAHEGYHVTSMSKIAKACGKNKATLYHYYKSKDELYNEILALYLRDFQANIGRSTLPLPEAMDQIHAYINVLIEQDPDILRIINRQLIDGYDYLTQDNLDKLQKIQKSFDAIFVLGIGNREFQMMSPKSIYHIIFGACSHYVLEHSLEENSNKRDDKYFIDELFSFVSLSIRA
jgi:TetR/AcrR family transcriptional regulator